VEIENAAGEGLLDVVVAEVIEREYNQHNRVGSRFETAISERYQLLTGSPAADSEADNVPRIPGLTGVVPGFAVKPRREQTRESVFERYLTSNYERVAEDDEAAMAAGVGRRGVAEPVRTDVVEALPLRIEGPAEGRVEPQSRIGVRFVPGNA
jgi:hypothetical protein